MRGRINRRLSLMMVLCLPVTMAASCNSGDLDTADGILSLVAGIVQLVFSIIGLF